MVPLEVNARLRNRFTLIRAIPGSNLLIVGDDWNVYQIPTQ